MSKLIYLSAGGTGGHVSPAAALAVELEGRGFDVQVLSDVRAIRYQSMFARARFHQISSGVLGGGPIGLIKGLAGLIIGVMQCLLLFLRKRPVAVVGFGGYPSVPGVFAAQILGVPTILHEQNAIIGKANLFLAKGARSFALSLPHDHGAVHKKVLQKSVVTGNPVRRDFVDMPSVLPVTDKFNLLIVGGSLGAKIFSDIVPKALAQFPADICARFSVVQQCRPEDVDAVRMLYADCGIQARVDVFFDDMAALTNDAHLFIGRSGASTVAEMIAAGRAAIYVPYPHHKDQQQFKNASFVVQQGGAKIYREDEFTVDILKDEIQEFLDNPSLVLKMGGAAKSCVKGAASEKLAELIVSVLEK